MKSKINIPDITSEIASEDEVVRPEVLNVAGTDFTKNQADVAKANASVVKSEYAYLQEGLKTAQAALDVVTQFIKLQDTTKEWEGRVDVAQKEVEKAQVELEKVKQKGAQQTERLQANAAARTIILDILNDFLADSRNPDTPDEKREALRAEMIDLVKELAKHRA